MTHLRALVLAMLVVILAIAGTPVHAQTTAYAAGQGAVNSIEVGVEVRASVLGRCGFAPAGAPSGSIDQADFDQSGFSRDFAIRLDCTGASRIAISSLNGGMAAPATGGVGYQTKAPYRVALYLVADNGTNASAACDASTLTAGGTCAFAGTAGTAKGLRLAGASTKANGSYLRVSAPAYSGSETLPAGRYSDTLSITVSVSP